MPAVRPLPAVGAPEATWRAWCRQFGLEGQLDSYLLGRNDTWSHLVDPDHRVVHVLTGAVPPPAPRRRGDRPLAERLVQTLNQLAEQNAALVRRHLEREPRRRAPPDAPELADAWRAVSDARDLHFPGQCSLVTYGPSVVVDRETTSVRVDWRGHRAVLQLDVQDLDGAHLACAVSSLEVLEALLDWLGTPSPGREALVRTLKVPRWRRSLGRLVAAAEAHTVEEERQSLGFEVALHETGWMVHPVLARPGKRRGWACRRVRPGQVPPALRSEPRDDRALRLVTAHRFAEALAELVGHPRVFGRGRGDKEPIAVRRGSPALGVRRTEAGDLRLTFDVDGAPLELARARVLHGVLADTAAGGVRVTHLTPGVARLYELAEHLPTVPADELGELLDALPVLSEQLPLDAEPGALGEAIPGDGRLLVALRWADDTLGVSVRVQALPESLPTPPGEGAALVCARRDGRVVHHRRELADERARAARQAEALGLSPGAQVGPADWLVADPQAALGIVERLRTAGGVRAAWEGDRLEVHVAEVKGLRLRVSRDTDWFGLQGDLDVAGRCVRLSALVRAARAGHRYVSLGKGHWAALDETLRARLTAVAPDQGGLTALHAPLLAALEDEGATIQGPPEWTRLHERVRDARALAVPAPAALRAELRAYQQEGVEWLGRLAHWAPGAVLADDMGLGKTVQTIALLLRRAAEGPALVVAPTSVVGNWRRELERFAPSLRVTTYGGPRRAEVLGTLAPGDVVLCTYGVLVNDADPFRAVRFATAVLDEAQAIRNPVAQRSAVAHGVDAAFRLALTGTPVENRSTDLWSILRFATPGLLGELPWFLRVFGSPVDSGSDVARRSTLAALVAPFVLRRTKRAVAPELPPRTDVELGVELSADERAAYDRLRHEAAARVAAAPERRRAAQLLEELTRLRQQVCHPRLVDPTTPLPSSKLQHAVRLLRDLREGGHRVLVFSTMVSLLELARDAVADDGFSWCWLDGSVPQARRQPEVERFQEGRTDLFFVSTKAGGVGLNLTAADYVLHLDPWWNPAAEDQASDRAHRIGQTRPVTVYRLVVRDTIEEHIVALHAHKRELADALLSGAGSTDLPDLEALAALLDGVSREARSPHAVAHLGVDSSAQVVSATNSTFRV